MLGSAGRRTKQPAILNRSSSPATRLETETLETTVQNDVVAHHNQRLSVDSYVEGNVRPLPPILCNETGSLETHRSCVDFMAASGLVRYLESSSLTGNIEAMSHTDLSEIQAGHRIAGPLESMESSCAINPRTISEVMDLRIALQNQKQEIERLYKALAEYTGEPVQAYESWAAAKQKSAMESRSHSQVTIESLRMSVPKSQAEQCCGTDSTTPVRAKRTTTLGQNSLVDGRDPEGLSDTSVSLVKPMIAKMTQCVIGTDMHKYVWHSRRNFFSWNKISREHGSVHRHKGFITLTPKEGTIHWCSGKSMNMLLGSKAYYIDEVFEVEDDTPPPEDQELHGRSLIIISEGRSLKFTAPDEATHVLWYQVIDHLLKVRKTFSNSPFTAEKPATQGTWAWISSFGYSQNSLFGNK